MSVGWLIACGEPISNQVFLDEASFVGSLPSADRLHAPSNVLLAPNGDAAVLLTAKAQAVRWDTWWTIASATGDDLGIAPADERTAVVRRWEARNVAARLTGDVFGNAGEVVDWWVQAEVVAPADGTPAWTIALSAAEDGPWVDVGAGETNLSEGTLTWDLAATATALGFEPPEPLGALSATFNDYDEAVGGRTVVADYELDGAVLPYGVGGEEVLAFTAPLSITSDGFAWPAFATVVHTPDGGRAQGIVLEEGIERTFTSCWDGSGMLRWQAGDGAVLAVGDTDTVCVIGPF